MDLQNLIPQQAQPIQRVTTGQLPNELAELAEEALRDNSGVLPSYGGATGVSWCSYDGEDSE